MLRLEVTCDPARIDFDRVYRFLNAQSYWAQGIARDLFDRAMKNSLCFAGSLAGEQIAFARVISDYATFANLCDVYVLESEQGRGLGTWLVETAMRHPDLQGLRRFSLATSDAHTLYRRFGFHAPARPDTLMERYHPDIYRKR